MINVYFLKMGNLKFFVAGFFLTLLFSAVSGQKGVEDGSKYGHGEDSIRCIKNLSISHDFVKQRNYITAMPYWQVVFDECPLCSKNIYLDGVKIYKYLLDKADENQEINNLLDTLMLIYDKRIQYFGETANVRGRQGVDLLRYGRNETSNIQKAYNYLKEAIDIDKESTSEPVLASYFSSSIILYQNDIISADDVIRDYIMVADLIKPTNKELTELKAAIDDNFIKQGPNDCNTLITFFTKEMDSKKEDVSFLRMLVSLLEERNCTESELYFSALQLLHKIAPGADLAFKSAVMAYKLSDYSLAIDYYQQALNLETNIDNKADYYFGIAACYNALNDKSKARELALRAIETRANWGDPYILIGQMYADSKNECSSIRLPNSIYWAAVDKFLQAKVVDPSVTERANALILTYSRYFPNKEEAFFENVHEGNAFTVGCWINETTKARFNN